MLDEIENLSQQYHKTVRKVWIISVNQIDRDLPNIIAIYDLSQPYMRHFKQITKTALEQLPYPIKLTEKEIWQNKYRGFKIWGHTGIRTKLVWSNGSDGFYHYESWYTLYLTDYDVFNDYLTHLKLI